MNQRNTHVPSNKLYGHHSHCQKVVPKMTATRHLMPTSPARLRVKV